VLATRAALAACAGLAFTACATPARPSPEPPPSAPASATAAAPELYGAGVFSTDAWDFFVAFTPDERRALFCRADAAFEHYAIFETMLDGAGRWSPPVAPRFAARWSNADPHISPDGKRVFFISNRPLPGEAAERAVHDIWVAELGADGAWGDAARLAPPVNLPGVDAWSPSVAANGDLYFGATRPGGLGASDLWVARWVGGAYQPPENLGDAINTAGDEVEPWIAPDGSYLIFSALRRADSLGSYDLFASRRVDGRWTPARRLPEPINSIGRDFNQSVSPDGRWLYFSSTRRDGKTGDIYRVALPALGD
jgi:Tol biopolymer transport system component